MRNYILVITPKYDFDWFNHVRSFKYELQQIIVNVCLNNGAIESEATTIIEDGANTM